MPIRPDHAGARPPATPCDVFLSYSRNDLEAAALLRAQLEHTGITVFKDDQSVREGDLWLEEIQAAVSGCGVFVVLVGRDGVQRWIGAEAQVALIRYFAPHDDGDRLPIFPVLLGAALPDSLPAFLRLFQATPWNGTGPLSDRLLEQIRNRTLVANQHLAFEGCPFVGLAAYRADQAHLFFGRQKETLDALACFESRDGRAPVRWLEINGNSGSGKSSLVNAGLLPLIEQGWLWPRTGLAHWRRIGPMMPGAHPVAMLAEVLARAWQSEMAEVHARLAADGEAALAFWLRGRKPDDQSAFLLAIDQFEELFTFADAEERRRFDRLLAAALEDPDCPLFVLSTVRSDFLDRFQDDLPRLVRVRNGPAKLWTLPQIGGAALREVIAGPARLAGLDVSEIKEVIVGEVRDEPGALPLVENALHRLWQQRQGNRLSGQVLTDEGGLAGILSGSADGLLVELDARERERALDLLFRLVRVDPEACRHTRRPISLAEAVAVAGGGEQGRSLVARLAGQRRRDGGTAEQPLRLITITEDSEKDKQPGGGPRINLIHETLIRSKGLDAAGKPQPYWPTLWAYIEKNTERAAQRERLRLLAREWKDRTGLSRLFGLAGWSSLLGFRRLAAPGSLEQRYLRWSRARAAVEAVALAAALGVIGEGVSWAMLRGAPFAVAEERWAYGLGAKPPLPRLVDIPAGSFRMGSEKDDESKPVHPVTFGQPFSIGATEVTFREWDACLADGGCNYCPADQGWGRDTRPVINVSWLDAQVYLAWLSRRMKRVCRLPSEAEWEYAARAGTASEFPLPAASGNDDIKGKALANCADCGSPWDLKQTAPVGQFAANAWGLHDMHGNVFEWVEDCWHENYADAPDNGATWREESGGNCSSRVLRGGSWYDKQDYARSATRDRYNPGYRYDGLGFRVLCSPPSAGH
ncbi:MAG: SUMF1/EgtB/PvdO family nonheme iron enzyme [Rhodospirillales bacterium]|nr:SUMF1/EgtB/PvdO family nonheme iron enzyme [Rhodospirillales bacterium]